MPAFKLKSSSSKFTELVWDHTTYQATSGGFGKGRLPSGEYKVKIFNVDTNAKGEGFKDPKTGEAWFIPLEPKFETDRGKAGKGGFGIHPDGGPVGTLGCIGLTGDDAAKFWKKWNATSMGNRPTSLKVE